LINDDAAYTVIDVVGGGREPQAVAESNATAPTAITRVSSLFIASDHTDPTQRCERRPDRLAIRLRPNHRRSTSRTLAYVLGHSHVELRAMPRGAERTAWRLRIAHLALLGQGIVIGVLGGFALAWSMANLPFGPDGSPILGLTLTPLHGALLVAGGALATLACLGRWTTVGFAAIAAGGWIALTIVCAIEAAHHAPGVLGFDPHDTVLYAALGVYNLALFTWLAPLLLPSARSGARR
jgi:hypothetical protein